MADEVYSHLEAGDPKGAWRSIKGWYRLVEDRPPKPCYQQMESVTEERKTLYTAAPPPGAPIPIKMNNNNKYPMYSRVVLDSEQPCDDFSVVLDF